MADEGKSQTGPALLGLKVRQEQFFFISRGNSAAGVGHHQLDGFGGSDAGAHQELLDQRIAHRFGGVIDQIHDDALELLGIDVDRRHIAVQIDAQIDAVEAAEKERERVFDDFVQIAWDGFGGGKARESREFVGQHFDGFHFARNRAGAFPQDAH